MGAHGFGPELRGRRRRPNRFVRVLRILLRPVDVRLLRHVVGPEGLADERAHLVERLFGDPGRVGPHISNEADRFFTRQLDALIELLGDHHGLLHRKARRLLQLARDEGRYCSLLAFLGGDRAHRPGRSAQVGKNRVGLFLVADLDRRAVTLQQLGLELGRLPGGQTGGNVPVLLRDEAVDLGLAIAHELQRNRLDPARTQPPPDLLPEQRADLVAHESVEDAPRLLRIHHLLVDLGRVIERGEDALLGDLVEHQPPNLLQVRAAELFCHMPADRFPLAVRVGCDEDGLGVLGGVLELLQDLLAAGDHFIGGFEAFLDVDAKFALGQIANMAHRRDDLVVLAQIFIDGLRLGRRFDHNQ